MLNYGEKFLEHFEYYFRKFERVELFKATTASIQVLAFPYVLKDVIIYASLGVSKFQNYTELYIATDCYFDEVEYLFGSILLYCIEQKISLARGVCLNGIADLIPAFTARTQKSAIYITLPHILPDSFSSLSYGDGNILQMLFISENEFNYIKKYGYSSFEDILDSAEVDVFNIMRQSII